MPGPNENDVVVTDIETIELSPEQLASLTSDEQLKPADETGEKPPAGEEATSEEKTSKSETVPEPFKYTDKDGKETEFNPEQLKTAVEDHLNKENWNKTNTDRATENKTAFELLKTQREAFGKSTQNLKAMTQDEKVMTALDEHYQELGQKNPLRELKFDQEQKTDVEKRLDVLENKDAEQNQALELARKAIGELVDWDPDNLGSTEKPNHENIDKIIKFANEHNEKHKDDEIFVAMSLKDAWFELYGKVKLGISKAKSSAKDAGETTTAKSKAAKSGKGKKPKTIDDAADQALENYLNM